ncbi:MAG: radical SAM protein [Candidatus Aminicenantes bacterium]|nr:MAG: radical SAM protein [Candidatus Aminicenantes bacterium]
MIAFGPVPSRRLGHSLGINNIPPKICTYSCIYCQIGRTQDMRVKRQTFYEPEEVFQEVQKRVEEAKERGEPIDYLTFVPDGEATLDINLGKEIELLRSLGIKIAVITNASLIPKKDVRDDLGKADWVSLKIDGLNDDLWRRINRPHRSLKLERILEGLSEFAQTFSGELATETMLVQDINDHAEELEKIADLIVRLKPKKSYISIPTRPPTERWVKPATENSINIAHQLFREKSIDVEYLIGYEGNAFAFTGHPEEDLLSITSVHPMREEGVNRFLKKAESDWGVIEKLITEGQLIEVKYKDKRFYMRKLSGPKRNSTHIGFKKYDQKI